MEKRHLPQILKIAITYSFIFIFFDTILEKIFYTIFDFNEYIYIGSAVFNPLFHFLTFILVLIFSHKKFIKEKVNCFAGILLISLLIILFSYFLKYIIELFFYYLNRSENNNDGQDGMQSLLNMFTGHPFSEPSFNPISHLIIYPFLFLKDSIVSLDMRSFLLTFLQSKLFISFIVIFYESLFYLFRKFNKNPWFSIVPIKNSLILLDLTTKPVWWIFPMLIPVIRYFPIYFVNLSLAEKSDKGNKFAIGMTLLPWYFYGLLSLDKIDEKYSKLQ